MTEITTHSAPGSALAIRRDQSDWTDEQAMALLDMFNLKNAPHAVIRSYFHVAQSTGLDPFKRQLHLIERGGKWTPQTSIDGFRLIRDRSKVYDGDETLWCGPDGVWREAWIDPDNPPVACKFSLYIKDRSRPVVAVALWREYAQMKGDSPTHMWAKMSAHMLAKVAEALAIRKAFPDDTGGLYTDDEMMQADVVDAAPAGGRKPAPGIADLMEPPVAQGAQTQGAYVADPGIGGGFMDAGFVADAAPSAAPAEPEQTAEEHAVRVAESLGLQPEQVAEVRQTMQDAAARLDDQRAYPPQADGEDVQDAEVVDDAPADGEQPMALADQEPAVGQPLDMDPARDPEHAYYWSAQLVELMQSEGLSEMKLRAFYDEAGAQGKLGEPVPWAGDGWTIENATRRVAENLAAGRQLDDMAVA